jgi:oxygen-independent coproporphyrinogen-3 oxidase
VRFSTPDSLDHYVAGGALQRTNVSREAALEENLFLGLRRNEGVSLKPLRAKFGPFVVTALMPTIVDLAGTGLIDWEGDRIRLTNAGRLLSNEVFERFLTAPSQPAK